MGSSQNRKDPIFLKDRILPVLMGTARRSHCRTKITYCQVRPRDLVALQGGTGCCKRGAAPGNLVFYDFHFNNHSCKFWYGHYPLSLPSDNESKI